MRDNWPFKERMNWSRDNSKNNTRGRSPLRTRLDWEILTTLWICWGKLNIISTTLWIEGRMLFKKEKTQGSRAIPQQEILPQVPGQLQVLSPIPHTDKSHRKLMQAIEYPSKSTLIRIPHNDFKRYLNNISDSSSPSNISHTHPRCMHHQCIKKKRKIFRQTCITTTRSGLTWAHHFNSISSLTNSPSHLPFRNNHTKTLMTLAH